MGTNNPSEEQLTLVQSRIIDLAASIAEEASMLEANSYFDEMGFDVESNGAQLSAKLKEYCAGSENIDDVDPSIEDHPQPRRMARYLLENVEYEILEKALDPKLLSSKPAVEVTAIKSAGGGSGGAMLFGYPRNLVLGLAAILILMVLAIGMVLQAGGGSASSNHVPLGGGGGGGRRGGGRGGRRNGSVTVE